MVSKPRAPLNLLYKHHPSVKRMPPASRLGEPPSSSSQEPGPLKAEASHQAAGGRPGNTLSPVFAPFPVYLFLSSCTQLSAAVPAPPPSGTSSFRARVSVRPGRKDGDLRGCRRPLGPHLGSDGPFQWGLTILVSFRTPSKHLSMPSRPDFRLPLDAPQLHVPLCLSAYPPGSVQEALPHGAVERGVGESQTHRFESQLCHLLILVKLTSLSLNFIISKHN